VIELGEWETVEVEGVQLSAEDRHLAERLRTGDRMLDVAELRRGLRMSARQHVGVVRFESMTVRVKPKLSGLEEGLAAMVRYAAGLDALRRPGSSRSLDIEGSDLFDLLAALLVEAVERLLSGGLITDYIEREELLPVVRGRLLYDRQLLERFGRLDRLWCRYDERNHATAENQLLQAALEVCTQRTLHEPTRRAARNIEGLFMELCGPLHPSWNPVEISYHRQNEHYREAHALARAILEGAGPRRLLREGPRQSFAFFVNMNRLFERFVERYLTELLAPEGVLISAQERNDTVLSDAETGTTHSHVQPDFVARLRDGRMNLPIDAKYKDIARRGVDSSDIYQAFLYAAAWATSGSPWRGLLVFPAIDDGAIRWIDVRTIDRRPLGRLGMVGVSLARVLGMRPGSTSVAEAELRGLFSPDLAQHRTPPRR
jgi:5-methylcytosine-specific restriction enzyme subunit McrC